MPNIIMGRLERALPRPLDRSFFDRGCLLGGVLRTDALGSKIRIEEGPGDRVQDVPHGVPLDEG